MGFDALGRGTERLGELQHREPVTPLEAQADDPPQRRRDRQHADPQGCTDRGPRRVASAEQLECEPHDGRHADEQEGRRVDPADREDDEREPRRVGPAAPPCGPCREADEPRQSGPREQEHRDARGERELVRREHVDERAGERPDPPDAEHPEQPPRAEHRAEGDRAEPEPLRDPVGRTDEVHEPEVRAHREQVADVLVRDRAHPHLGVPQERGPLQERAGVEVQVLLRVGAELAARRQEERHIREQDEPDELEHAAAVGAPSRGPRRLNRHPAWDRRRVVGDAEVSAIAATRSNGEHVGATRRRIDSPA